MTVYYMAIVIALLFFILFLVLEREGLTTFAFILLCGSIVTACENSDWEKERNKAQAEQDRRDATPHVIREADGCKVYAFKTDRDHYFTRCGGTVTTETNFTVYCGKNCRREESDTIVTKENK